MATYYYNNATGDFKWYTLGNWWMNDACTVPATVRPIAQAVGCNTISVVIKAPVQQIGNSSYACCVSATITGSGYMIKSLVTGGYLNGSFAIGPYVSTGTWKYNGQGENCPLEEHGVAGYVDIIYQGATGFFDGQYYVNGQPRKLFFDARVNHDWNTLGNWWNNYALTDPATSLPTSSDDVVITQGVISYTGSDPLAQTFIIQGSGYIVQSILDFLPASNTVANSTNVSCVQAYLGASTFYDGHAYYSGLPHPNGWNGLFYYINDIQTTLDSSGSGFYDGFAYYNTVQQATGWNGFFYYIDNTQTTLDSSGSGVYDGGYYVEGGLTGLNSSGYGEYNGLHYSAYPTTYQGWDGAANTYYFSGIPTTLNSGGDGSYGGEYYFGGVVASGLDSNGSGFYNGHAYLSGTEQPNGWNGYFYYISDVETSLDSSGDGCWNNSPYSSGNRTFDPSTDTGYNTCDSLYYVSGVSTSLDSSGYGDYNGLHYSAYPTEYGGYDAFTSYYYIAGVQTTLDSAGTGFYNSHAYLNGTAQPTGWNTLYYYINDVETTLDSNGSGYWSGDHYSLGSIFNPTTYAFMGTSDGDWNNLSNWLADYSISLPAGQLPTATDNVALWASVTSNGGSEPTVANLEFSSTMPGLTIGINFTVTGKATINYGYYTTGTITGNATLNGSSYNTGIITGTATFNNTSHNDGTVGSGVFNDTSSNGLNAGGGSASIGYVTNNAVFNDSSTNGGGQGGSKGIVSGNAIFNDSSVNNCYYDLNDGGATPETGDGFVHGSATFKGQSTNKKGIGGSVILAYDKGINGSNILGIF